MTRHKVAGGAPNFRSGALLYARTAAGSPARTLFMHSVKPFGLEGSFGFGGQWPAPVPSRARTMTAVDHALRMMGFNVAPGLP